MSFVKLASADVIELRWAKEKVANYAGYRKLSDITFNDYLTSDGYIYARVRAIASKTNKNWDSWPAEELKQAYQTFVGKPIFVDHHNHDPKRARGVVVDAALHYNDQHFASLEPYYASHDVDPLHLPPTYIELLLEVDAKRFPRLAKAIVSGDIDSVSMGADVGYTLCNICSNRAEDPSQFCRHIMAKGAYFDYKLPDGTKTSKRAAEHCFKVAFFEISWVFEPAEESALALDIKTANMKPDPKQISKTASMFDHVAGDIFDQENEEPGLEWVDQPGNEPEPGLANREGESERVKQWRYQRALQMGYNPEMAQTISEQEYRGPGVGTDLHDLERLIGQGAPHDQAYQIVSKKYALAPVPQADMTKMPQSVDTLRQEDVCPVCGSTMGDGECNLCGYTQPPEGFDNPDLQKAQEVDKQLHDNNPALDNPGESMDSSNEISSGGGGGSPAGAPSSSPMMPTQQMAAKYVLAHVNGDGSLTVINKTAAAPKQPVQRINTSERPLLPPGRQHSDLPLAVRTLQNPTRPLESNLRLKTKEYMPNTKTADGATPWGEGTQAEKRVELLDVGGVSGDPLSGIESVDVAKDTGDFTAPHTKTWGAGDGDSLGQHDPVTSDSFEGGGQGSGNAAASGGTAPYQSSHMAADGPEGLGGPIGDAAYADGAAQSGNSAGGESAPAFPDSHPTRVDLNAPLREETGDRTMTFGQDDFHITNPVTKGEEYDANNLGGPIGTKASSFAFAMKAVKLAEAEAALGVIPNKWQRVAELETKTEEYVDAQIEALTRYRTAAVRQAANRKVAGRMPSLRNSTTDPAALQSSTVGTEDSLHW